MKADKLLEQSKIKKEHRTHESQTFSKKTISGHSFFFKHCTPPPPIHKKNQRVFFRGKQKRIKKIYKPKEPIKLAVTL